MYGGKKLVSIKYHILDSYKEGALVSFQGIPETKWMSNWYSLALFKFSLKNLQEILFFLAKNEKFYDFSVHEKY